MQKNYIMNTMKGWFDSMGDKMKYTLSELNNASTIILDAKGFLKIKIDKKEGIITEVSKIGKESNIDVTQEVLDIESNYSIGDIVVDTPY